MNIMNIILEAVNIPKYFPLRLLFSFAIYLKLISLPWMQSECRDLQYWFRQLKPGNYL